MDLPALDLGDQALVRHWQLFLVEQEIKMDLFSMSGDGIFGPGTRKGTIEYQLKHGLNPTGTLDLETYEKALQHGLSLGKD